MSEIEYAVQYYDSEGEFWDFYSWSDGSPRLYSDKLAAFSAREDLKEDEYYELV